MSGSLPPLGYAFKLAFQLSPIFLTGSSSLVNWIGGGMFPLIFLTEPLHLVTSLASGGENVELDDFFAHFAPIGGATLINNQIAQYPFANQRVAANALICQPLEISLKMICPVRDRLGYAAKLATMMTMQSVLFQHNAQGGTYTIATPSYLYLNCIMTAMRDISGGESNQVQHTWQLDFQQPLLTQEEADAVQNSFYSKVTAGLQINSSSMSTPDINIGQTLPNVTGLGPGGVTAEPLPPVAGASTLSNIVGTFGGFLKP
jgi:hypothetical protein